MYFSTNGEAYQVLDCNVETHEDRMKTSRNVERHEECTQTSQVEDIIYLSWPGSIVMIMYELDTYEKYLRRRRYLDIIDHDGPGHT